MVNILNDVSVSSIKIFIALLSMRQVVDTLVKEKKKTTYGSFPHSVYCLGGEVLFIYLFRYVCIYLFIQ